jgi:hypothetical protein
MTIAIVLFVVGALFGLHVLTHILKEKPTPKVSVVLHGLIVATALVIVIINVMRGGSGLLVTSMVFFIMAALGGAYLAYVDNVKKLQPPKAIAIMHPMIAAVGLVMLIIYVFGKP